MQAAAPTPTHAHEVNVDAAFAERLLAWYRHYGRHDLPWKIDPTPYRVWLSEIMLQQTQVATVLAYFERFTARFPDIASLAAADEDDVLAAWTGLGYYRRARNLHATARRIVVDHGGHFPCDRDTLMALPGIGRSTAGAILALAFDERAAILDGNVKRVLSRLHAIREWPGLSHVERQLWSLAEAHTPTADAAAYTQAIMDLGATVCTRKRPDCDRCPALTLCAANRLGISDEVPAPSPRRTLPQREGCMVIIEDTAGRLLLEKRPEQGVWGGLWCFPELSADTDPETAADRLGGKGGSLLTSTATRHVFTHYRLDLTLHHVRLPHSAPLAAAEKPMNWFAPEELSTVGLAAPVVRFRQTATSN